MGPGCVLLDRDGVINEDSDDFILNVASWRPIPGSLEAIARLTEADIPVAVCTNQSAIGRGMLSRSALTAIHAHMQAAVTSAGGMLAGIFVCPHSPDTGCRCRKPAPGLINDALNRLDCAARDAVLIGDSQRDIEAALNAGVPARLVRTGNGQRTKTLVADDIPVYDDLATAVEALLV